jgi:hypothetical protein
MGRHGVKPYPTGEGLGNRFLEYGDTELWNVLTGTSEMEVTAGLREGGVLSAGRDVGPTRCPVGDRSFAADHVSPCLCKHVLGV